MILCWQKLKFSVIIGLAIGCVCQTAFSDSHSLKAKEEKSIERQSSTEDLGKNFPASNPETIDAGDKRQSADASASDPKNSVKEGHTEEVLYHPNSRFEVTAPGELELDGDDLNLESVDGTSGEVRQPQKLCTGAKACAKLNEQATLEITSNIPNAVIMLDELIVGEIGDTLDVKAGTNEVRVSAPGLPEKKLTVRAKKGEHIKIHVELGKGH